MVRGRAFWDAPGRLWRLGALGVLAGIALIVSVVAVVRWTAPERESVQTYTELISAANRQDIDSARRLCTGRYNAKNPLKAAPEGGIVGLPRGIHKNFQVWRDGEDVRLCPMNRVGPVYRFVHERGGWRFDGPVGILRGRGEFLPLGEDVAREEIGDGGA